MNQGPLALTREIDEFRRQFEQISADADALVTPLGNDQFTWKPASNKWSIAECLEHLNATARAYLPFIDEGIADAIRHGAYAEGPFHYSMPAGPVCALGDSEIKQTRTAVARRRPALTRSRGGVIRPLFLLCSL